MGEIIGILVSGSIGGWLAGYFMHKDKVFDLSDVVVGVLGAIAGGAIVTFVPGLNGEGPIDSVLTALLGSVVLTWLYERYQRGQLTG
jgi:uncharacterized membrane protein YeaQ/YmgE (transglycosylase-associated protein family)